MSRQVMALLCVIAGFLIASAALASIDWRAAVVLLGGAVAAFGLLGFEVDE